MEGTEERFKGLDHFFDKPHYPEELISEALSGTDFGKSDVVAIAIAKPEKFIEDNQSEFKRVFLTPRGSKERQDEDYRLHYDALENWMGIQFEPIERADDEVITLDQRCGRPQIISLRGLTNMNAEYGGLNRLMLIYSPKK
ncbi:hypothetical protein KY340_01445 [Candidatus Woesearchaeota archaeon]|nr:hypothetical protein [Candidatus Woesearchaeota archaeon]